MTPLTSLKRYPVRGNELLQAWDSADELIVKHAAELDLSGKRILVLNDQFGALSCALMDRNLTSYVDSFVSSKAIQLNSNYQVKPISQLAELSGPYDLALIRIPKNMSFFEDLLSHLSQHLHPGSKVICGYMIKHQADASFKLLDKLIGKTMTSLAKKKARLIFAHFEHAPFQSRFPLQVPIEGFPHPLINHSNLFSREKLDIGTRFLLEHIPKGNYKTILDLGCANGIIGIAAKKSNPSARIILCDDSQMAIQSAKANFNRYFPEEQAEFLWTNCYEGGAPDSVDLVICNPPFHQGNTVGDFVARQMFRDSHRALAPGGRLRVIGNTHLKYHHELKKVFGNSEIIAKNNKFSIIDTVK